MYMHLFEARTTTKLSRQLSETSPMTERRNFDVKLNVPDFDEPKTTSMEIESLDQNCYYCWIFATQQTQPQLLLERRR